MKTSIKLIIRKDFKRKDGSNSIFLRLTINRKSKYYPLGISVYEGDLLKDKFLFKNSVKDSALKNMKINQTMANAQQIINDFIKFEKPSTFTEFDLRFKSNYNTRCFYDFALNYINTNKNLSDEAVRTYKSLVTKIKKFEKKKHFFN
jgi:hypothetical protein